MSAQPEDPPQPAARRPRDRRATSEELVAAATRVIGREGVAAATTRKIAEEAGVPLGTVHYWFADKNALLESVVRHIVERLERAASPAELPDGGASEADVRTALRAAWAEVERDDPGTQLGYYEVTALALRTPAMRELARTQYRSYRDLAARAMAPALAGVPPERAALLAEFVAVAFDGLALAWLADPEGTHPEQVLDLLAEALLGDGPIARRP